MLDITWLRYNHRCHYETYYARCEASVLHCDVSEEVTHALLVMDPPYGLCQQNADVYSLDLVCLGLLSVVGNTVSHDHLVNAALVDQYRRLLGENPVCGHAVDLAGSVVFQHLGSLDEALDVVHDVVHHDGNLAVHVAH